MSGYLFFSHDGCGLGHARRNVVLARAVLGRDPEARVTLVSGVPLPPRWLDGMAIETVVVPALLKDATGAYRPDRGSFEEAVARRAATFAATVDRVRPDVVVVDRHPYGIAGELREGLLSARRSGAALVLGLRDLLDDPAVVVAEVAGPGWEAAPELFDEVLVYGASFFCDHRAEYLLPVEPVYCGWVVDAIAPAPRDPELLVVTAGGGVDGDAVFRLGLRVLEQLPSWRAVLATGTVADRDWTRGAAALGGRVRVEALADCSRLYACARATLQMGGYNASYEALAAGLRPVIVPRRRPRREQELRAARLTAFGLADAVADDADVSSLVDLLERPRTVDAAAVAEAGFDLDGAARVAARLGHLARAVCAA